MLKFLQLHLGRILSVKLQKLEHTLHHHLGQLFYKQRHPIRLGHHLLHYLHRQGLPTRHLSVLLGLYRVYTGRAEYTTARELGEQVLTLAQQEQDPGMLMEAHVWIGLTSFFLGEVTEALRHTEQAFSLYDSRQHRSHGFLYGWDPGRFPLPAGIAPAPECRLFPPQELKSL